MVQVAAVRRLQNSGCEPDRPRVPRSAALAGSVRLYMRGTISAQQFQQGVLQFAAAWDPSDCQNQARWVWQPVCSMFSPSLVSFHTLQSTIPPPPLLKARASCAFHCLVKVNAT